MAAPATTTSTTTTTPARYVRFRSGGWTGYGRLEGEAVVALDGNPISGQARDSGVRHALADVQLLVPAEPRNIAAVGRNYRSHLGTREAPRQPELFWKPLAALQHTGGPIVLPADATDVHFEGELVLVMGPGAGRDLDLAAAAAAIFGVTCGNDVSERQWQRGPSKDLQWWRAKGCDTFAVCGPVIATGLPPGDLLLTTRVNGEVAQQQRTTDLLFDCATVVSYLSRYVTLAAGDLVYTGTPGETRALRPGDVVEVEIEGVGVLRNPVVQGSGAAR
jgi:2-keto-4-pentenoate hydratase/2-oxohepta-3-ene-1,7-dioic acid hydratase in catechol pathway